MAEPTREQVPPPTTALVREAETPSESREGTETQTAAEHPILRFQRQAGNQAVARMLEGRGDGAAVPVPPAPSLPPGAAPIPATTPTPEEAAGPETATEEGVVEIDPRRPQRVSPALKRPRPRKGKLPNRSKPLPLPKSPRPKSSPVPPSLPLPSCPRRHLSNRFPSRSRPASAKSWPLRYRPPDPLRRRLIPQKRGLRPLHSSHSSRPVPCSARPTSSSGASS